MGGNINAAALGWISGGGGTCIFLVIFREIHITISRRGLLFVVGPETVEVSVAVLVAITIALGVAAARAAALAALAGAALLGGLAALAGAAASGSGPPFRF